MGNKKSATNSIHWGEERFAAPHPHLGLAGRGNLRLLNAGLATIIPLPCRAPRRPCGQRPALLRECGGVQVLTGRTGDRGQVRGLGRIAHGLAISTALARILPSGLVWLTVGGFGGLRACRTNEWRAQDLAVLDDRPPLGGPI